MILGRIKIYFKNLKDQVLDTKTNNIIAALKENPNFSLTNEIAKVEAALAKFIAAVAAAANRGRREVAAKNVAKAELEVALKELAMTVNAQAKGDDEKLLSSGFDLVRRGGKLHLRPVQKFILEYTFRSGQIKISVDVPIENFNGMQIRYTTADKANTDINTWTVVICSGYTTIIENLIKGVEYVFIVSYIGTTTDEPIWSERITKMAI
ncbi:MAG: hypothetical protein ACRC0V_12695 [Fusobacteriaceae bacterium]